LTNGRFAFDEIFFHPQENRDPRNSLRRLQLSLNAETSAGRKTRFSAEHLSHFGTGAAGLTIRLYRIAAKGRGHTSGLRTAGF
jgi:hypothetical protein